MKNLQLSITNVKKEIEKISPTSDSANKKTKATSESQNKEEEEGLTYQDFSPEFSPGFSPETISGFTKTYFSPGNIIVRPLVSSEGKNTTIRFTNQNETEIQPRRNIVRRLEFAEPSGFHEPILISDDEEEEEVPLHKEARKDTNTFTLSYDDSDDEDNMDTGKGFLSKNLGKIKDTITSSSAAERNFRLHLRDLEEELKNNLKRYTAIDSSSYEGKKLFSAIENLKNDIRNTSINIFEAQFKQIEKSKNDEKRITDFKKLYKDIQKWMSDHISESSKSESNDKKRLDNLLEIIDLSTDTSRQKVHDNKEKKREEKNLKLAQKYSNGKAHAEKKSCKVKTRT